MAEWYTAIHLDAKQGNFLLFIYLIHHWTFHYTVLHFCNLNKRHEHQPRLSHRPLNKWASTLKSEYNELSTPYYSTFMLKKKKKGVFLWYKKAFYFFKLQVRVRDWLNVLAKKWMFAATFQRHGNFFLLGHCFVKIVHYIGNSRSAFPIVLKETHR